MKLVTGKTYLVDCSPIEREEDWCEMSYDGYYRTGPGRKLHHFKVIKGKRQPKSGTIGFGTLSINKVREVS